MSNFVLKLNTWSIFRNDKIRSDKSQTHSGKALIDGREYSISAWVREGKTGTRYFSLSFNPVAQTAPSTAPTAAHLEEKFTRIDMEV